MSLDQSVWDRTLAVNVTAPMVICKNAIPSMLERGGGAIVNVSSVNALLGDVVRPAYAVSKAGLNLLTLNIATSYGKQGIRCNGVCPGMTMSASAEAQAPEAFLEIMRRQTPSPRFGTPWDLANAIVYLASDEAAFINGQIIAVDGGLTAQLPQAQEMSEIGRPRQKALQGF